MKDANGFLIEGSVKLILCFPREGYDLETAWILVDGEVLERSHGC